MEDVEIEYTFSHFDVFKRKCPYCDSVLKINIAHLKLFCQWCKETFDHNEIDTGMKTVVEDIGID